MTKPIFFAAILLLSMYLYTGCYNDNRDDLYPTTSDCDSINTSYSAFIAPLMNTSCAVSGCHDAATASFAIILDNYAGVQQIALDGRLMGSITHAPGFYPMPQSTTKLDNCSIAKIRNWVNAGAPEH